MKRRDAIAFIFLMSLAGTSCQRLKTAVELHFTTGMDLVCYQGVPVN
jgi:hypothetical protein